MSFGSKACETSTSASSEAALEAHRPSLLFLATEDWFFASHFIGFAKAARRAGFEPGLAARVGQRGEALAGSNFRVMPLKIDRGKRGPAALFRAVSAYRKAIKDLRPSVVHCIALKPIILGGFAAWLENVPVVVLAPTGLGSAWVKKGKRAWLARLLLRSGVRVIARLTGARFLFENQDDPLALGLSHAQIREATFVAGAGVDPAAFTPQPIPASTGPVRVAVVARMVTSKGILDAVEAVRLVRRAGHDVVLDLWGAPDPDNPASLTPDELSELARIEGIFWHGPTNDVVGVWREAHIAMLLSHGGEGLPRSLIEAAACARPIVTTDVPGCRNCVDNDREGYRVSPHNPQDAAEAIARLAADPVLRSRLGHAARVRFERDMTAQAVEGRVEALYRSLASRLEEVRR